VHTAYVLPPLPGDGVFAASTTGLAAGFEEADAVAHGLLECIERDAIARALRTHGFFQNRRIDPDTIADPELRDLMEILTAGGLLVGLWQAPSPVGIPVVWCHLLEDGPQGSILLPHPADGSAAARDPALAVMQAICEAAQARLAAISGARDDMTRDHYPRYPDRRMIEAHRGLLRDGPRRVHFGALAERPAAKAGGRSDMLLAKLEAAGIDAAYIVRVDTEPVDGLSVVRIVIPALQPPMQD
jgi:ribosomal protein S12 methylthiotransferase accessory factor